MSRLLGTSGIVLILAGLCLLWQARCGFIYWLERYLRIFKSGLEQPQSNRALPRPVPPSRGPRPAPTGAGLRRERTRGQELETLRIVVGVILALLLGPALVALGLTF